MFLYQFIPESVSTRLASLADGACVSLPLPTARMREASMPLSTSQAFNASARRSDTRPFTARLPCVSHQPVRVTAMPGFSFRTLSIRRALGSSEAVISVPSKGKWMTGKEAPSTPSVGELTDTFSAVSAVSVFAGVSSTLTIVSGCPVHSSHSVLTGVAGSSGVAGRISAGFRAFLPPKEKPRRMPLSQMKLDLWRYSGIPSIGRP